MLHHTDSIPLYNSRSYLNVVPLRLAFSFLSLFFFSQDWDYAAAYKAEHAYMKIILQECREQLEK